MKRSDFIKGGLLAAGAGLSGHTFASTNQNATNMMDKGKTFNLNYAPHQGMFKNHAGDNFLDEIRYMHDLGFRGIEDNGYLGRTLDEQKKVGDLLAKLGMTMGVFVVDGGQNWMPSLATGKKEFLDKFVKPVISRWKRPNAVTQNGLRWFPDSMSGDYLGEINSAISLRRCVEEQRSSNHMVW
ncbi:hypothetical protein KUH03_36535 [Sphingobacterium sp. E70]|uniref:hypothetical protein n=1 Tax=Sphingobacterium sp. E70 TaxID=2853439 RepID=UPI00211BB12B|nr:hypothetical protein [Sphingobacterium sp. E70]ULT24438.1 hypothetical protein KUH03_36535 [Sphingobacterium sp. E70]